MKPKIPKGWRRIRTGTWPKQGDMIWDVSFELAGEAEWAFEPVFNFSFKVDPDEFIIRRVAKKGRK